MIVFIFIIIFVLLIIWFDKTKSLADSYVSQEKTVEKGYIDWNKYMSVNVPDLLMSYNIFKPSFLEKLSFHFLENNTPPSITEEDIYNGVNIKEAIDNYNHCFCLASARYNSKNAIKNAINAEANYIHIKVFRKCPSCTRVPDDKLYDVLEEIPLYPCKDCRETEICSFWYDIKF